MADLEYFVICRSVSFEVETDEITLSGVIEDIFPASFPETLPRIVAVSAWRISPHEADEDFQAALRVLLPGEDESSQFTMNLARGRLRHKALLAITDIPLEKEGDLRFEVLLNGQHAATHVVTVHPPKGVISD